MKKIIALAVASAFVAPAFAADVTVSGVMDYSYKDVSTSTTSTKSLAEDSTLIVKASGELANGLSISADYNLTQGGEFKDGNSIDVSGPFGKISLGDSAGAVDSLDGGVSIDRTVEVSTNGTNFASFAADTAVRWDLPAFAPGLAIALTHSPKDSAPAGATADMDGVVVTYTAGPVKVGYAQEEVGDLTYSGFTLVGTFGNFAASYETWDEEEAATATDSLDAVTVKYTMGDIVLAARNASESTGSVDNSEVSSYFVNYTLGAGTTLFLEVSSEDKLTTADEETAVGIEYKF